jgi:hypothetical protein
VYVLLKTEEKSMQAIVSIIISAATAGFASASIAFDFDVDPKKRRETPEFYGYIPDGMSRTVVFCCMMLNGTLLLLVRSFCVAMLMLVKKKYFVWYYAGDMGFYLLLKAARGDFHHWMPFDSSLAESLTLSLVMRVALKTIVDFTGIVQFRGSAELGGIYWSCSMFCAIIAPFAVLEFYFANVDASDHVMDEESAWLLVGSMSSAWAATFGLFLRLIKKKYFRTFFSLERGCDWAMNKFLHSDLDSDKKFMITVNKNLWKPLAEEAKKWVHDNWDTWEEEQPEWFTEAWKKRLAVDWLSAAESRRQAMTAGRIGGKRRSSFNLVAGSSGKKKATVVPAEQREYYVTK